MPANTTAMIQKLKRLRLVDRFLTYRNHAWFIPSILIAISLVIAILVDIKEKTAKADKDVVFDGIDTFIPTGFVLLPIEVQNLASLDSLIGQHGIVDVYVSGSSAPLARAVKIMRSPKNPMQFSILVPEAQSTPLIRASDKPFFVLVQNPKTRSVPKIPVKPSRIVIEN